MMIRDYRPQDLAGCALSLHEGFFTQQMTPALLAFFKDYAFVLVNKSSFTLVAEADGQVVGFLCAEYKKEFSPKLAKSTLGPYMGTFLRWTLETHTNLYHLPKSFQKEFALFMREARNMVGKDLGVCDCELASLSSRKDYRKGLGTALVNAMVERCQAAGARTIRLFTNTDASYRFYDKYGFHVVAQKYFDGGGHSATSLVYEYVT